MVSGGTGVKGVKAREEGEHAGEGIARGEGSKEFSDLGRMDILVI